MIISACMIKSDIKTCQTYDRTECDKFIPTDLSKKCVYNSYDERCKLKNKECEEMDVKYCNKYRSSIYDDRDCVPNSDNTKCELKLCSELDINEFQKYNPPFIYSQCLPNSNNTECEIKECEEQNPNECNKFRTDDLIYKCTSNSTHCIFEYKECSELTNELCQNHVNCYLNENKCVKRRNWDDDIETD